jgi:hypothetical protein
MKYEFNSKSPAGQQNSGLASDPECGCWTSRPRPIPVCLCRRSPSGCGAVPNAEGIMGASAGKMRPGVIVLDLPGTRVRLLAGR